MGWYRRSRCAYNYFKSGFSRSRDCYSKFKHSFQQNEYVVEARRYYFENQRNVDMAVLVGSGSGLVITIYAWNLETIPFTKRTHVVLLPKSLERKLGETIFKIMMMKLGFRGKILPATHPKSVRVGLIANEIIGAAQRELRNEVQEGYLEGLNWEVVVVNKPVVNAFCLPGGKIVVFTGLLKYFKSDAEIATIIGHEVGHVVARHGAESVTKHFLIDIILSVLLQTDRKTMSRLSDLFLSRPFSRRMEMEADYIGLRLMASAGYDPRVAPTVFEKIGKTIGESIMTDYLSTHPSGTKRAKFLTQAMDEALMIYRQVQSQKDIQNVHSNAISA